MCHEKESGEKHKDSGRKGRDLLARGWRDTDGCVCVCIHTAGSAALAVPTGQVQGG